MACRGASFTCSPGWGRCLWGKKTRQGGEWRQGTGRRLKQSSRRVSDGCSAQHHSIPPHLIASVKPEHREVPQNTPAEGPGRHPLPTQGILAAGLFLVEHCSSLSSLPERGSDFQSCARLRALASPTCMDRQSPEDLL